MVRAFFIFLTLSQLSYADLSSQITFRNHGKDFKKHTIQELMKMGVPTATLKVKSHLDPTEVEYTGFVMPDLLKKIYGKELGNAEELFMTCTDGYQPSIPLLKFGKHQSIFAFERKDKKPFEFFDDKKRAQNQYGPLFLAWENINDIEMRDQDSFDWPFQVVAFDLVDFSEKFAEMAPRKKSSESVKRGFAYFRQQCLNCHTINGKGGGMGPELNFPLNITEYMKEEVIIKWLREPNSVRWNSKMSPAFPKHPQREQVLKDILSYLKEMSHNKKQP